MGKQLTPNYRGKGVSRDKLTKDGHPKHAGNFSYQTVHVSSLQSKDYQVTLKKDADGEPILIVGNSTPLCKVMPQEVALLALHDKFLDTIVRSGKAKIKGKEYDSRKTLRRFHWPFHAWAPEERVVFIYREEIYTDGDFVYEFPNY